MTERDDDRPEDDKAGRVLKFPAKIAQAAASGGFETVRDLIPKMLVLLVEDYDHALDATLGNFGELKRCMLLAAQAGVRIENLAAVARIDHSIQEVAAKKQINEKFRRTAEIVMTAPDDWASQLEAAWRDWKRFGSPPLDEPEP